MRGDRRAEPSEKPVVQQIVDVNRQPVPDISQVERREHVVVALGVDERESHLSDHEVQSGHNRGDHEERRSQSTKNRVDAFTPSQPGMVGVFLEKVKRIHLFHLRVKP